MTNEPINTAASRVEGDAQRYLKEGDTVALAGLSDEGLEEYRETRLSMLDAYYREMARRHRLEEWGD